MFIQSNNTKKRALSADEFKITYVRHEKGKFAIMGFYADEEYETYDPEIERVSDILTGEKNVGHSREISSRFDQILGDFLDFWCAVVRIN